MVRNNGIGSSQAQAASLFCSETGLYLIGGLKGIDIGDVEFFKFRARVTKLGTGSLIEFNEGAIGVNQQNSVRGLLKEENRAGRLAQTDTMRFDQGIGARAVSPFLS